MFTLFISDLHLDPRRPNTTQAFVKLVQSAKNADAIYILGDFVEYWIGDDDKEHGLHDAFACLKNTADSGVPIYLMHGNRDFLIGERFAADYNIKLIPDSITIDLYGVSTLLMHGDLLCTDDIAYQQFRAMVRSPDWQMDFLNKSLAERRAIVHGLRETSRQETDGKTDAIMDVSQTTVEKTMQQFQVQRLIHGHTHKPNHHQFIVDDKKYERWVLGDWYQQAQILRCSEDQLEFETISL